jgi:hypothetical protein
VHALSVAFRDVLEEQASMTEPENDWVKGEGRAILGCPVLQSPKQQIYITVFVAI